MRLADSRAILRAADSLLRETTEAADPARVADALLSLPSKELEAKLTTSTGLSRAVVTDAIDGAFESLTSELRIIQALPGRRAKLGFVHLASNVFTACLRPMATAAVLGIPLLVRVSSREGVFAEAVAACLKSAKLARVEVLRFDRADAAAFVAATTRADFIEAYGDEETLDALQCIVSEDVPFIRRGHGLGGVLLGEIVSPEGYAGLASDVAAYDQRGCLSPRIVFAAGNLQRHAEAIHETLDQVERKLPRGTVPPDVQSASAQWRNSAAALHSIIEGESHALVVADSLFPLGPTHRHLLIRPIDSAAETLSAFGPQLKVVGHEGLPETETWRALSTGRFCALGKMQRPRLSAGADGYPPCAGFVG